jgi:hypothetical protein
LLLEVVLLLVVLEPTLVRLGHVEALIDELLPHDLGLAAFVRLEALLRTRNVPCIVGRHSHALRDAFDRKVFNNIWGTFTFGPDNTVYLGAYRGFLRFWSDDPLSE